MAARDLCRVLIPFSRAGPCLATPGRESTAIGGGACTLRRVRPAATGRDDDAVVSRDGSVQRQGESTRRDRIADFARAAGNWVPDAMASGVIMLVVLVGIALAVAVTSVLA